MNWKFKNDNRCHSLRLCLTGNKGCVQRNFQENVTPVNDWADQCLFQTRCVHTWLTLTCCQSYYSLSVTSPEFYAREHGRTGFIGDEVMREWNLQIECTYANSKGHDATVRCGIRHKTSICFIGNKFLQYLQLSTEQLKCAFDSSSCVQNKNNIFLCLLVKINRRSVWANLILMLQAEWMRKAWSIKSCQAKPCISALCDDLTRSTCLIIWLQQINSALLPLFYTSDWKRRLHQGQLFHNEKICNKT